jgi:hypothetical protein
MKDFCLMDTLPFHQFDKAAVLRPSNLESGLPSPSICVHIDENDFFTIKLIFKRIPLILLYIKNKVFYYSQPEKVPFYDVNLP